MLSVEAMQIARLLNLHRISDYEGLNCIETQLRKKGFWLVFYCYVHASLQNLQGERLTYLDPAVLQLVKAEDLIPLEIDDEFIFEHEVVFPPSRLPSSHPDLFYTPAYFGRRSEVLIRIQQNMNLVRACE
ncbi:hypothetical protein N7509_000695 [Penicillium cosmopolitanum]|uniref:Transcription factor domain-containing protein n=1 Tax=Penicillium cosmopolitanum TaxID=1131564 RepID=A0A9W9WB44_9EURO|nr:uncharacterized protein N7509_000695 [Penicillium cosmopolitanum]KAJ5414068.1 hypothetical protein N7509_000695 [Penicillium cosmopolitanum]